MADAVPSTSAATDGQDFTKLVDKQISEGLVKKGLALRDHQKLGIARILKWKKDGHGGILADEMGLGKTCQAAIIMWQLYRQGGGPFLVLSPLSVLDHFGDEISRFTCGSLEAIKHYGNREVRWPRLEKLNGKLERNHVFVIPYHLAIQDFAELMKFHTTAPFTAVIVDEAQKTKCADTQLYSVISQFQPAWMLLMTGTPIQNNVKELYTLLSLCDPSKFPVDEGDEFQEKHKAMKFVAELKVLMEKYVLRRTKEAVFDDVPPYDQVILYHGLSELQKDMYMKMISKDHEALSTFFNGKSNRLISLMVELRKLVSHPYLFRGVEPEPFKEGEHLVETSGKLQMLDRLLKHLKKSGHRCLVFSQFVMVMDIVQDFVTMRGYDYERIDGTVRAEERYAAMNRFHDTKNSKKGPFLFLLTTRAGGVGLNLVGADTAIFIDSDWNPQSDLQAMARCHRIGQIKPVRVIRLVARYTVEQYQLLKARQKLKLTEALMDEKEENLSAVAIQNILKCGLKGLKNTRGKKTVDMTDEALERIIGHTDKKHCWMPLVDNNKENEEKEEEFDFEHIKDVDEVNMRDVDGQDYMVYEGKAYRGMEITRARTEDDELFEELVKRGANEEEREKQMGKVAGAAHVLTDEEVNALRERREQAAKKRAQTIRDKLQKKREDAGYVSSSLPTPNDDQAHHNDNEEAVGERMTLQYVHGDVTHPQQSDEDDHSETQIIVHCVDNGGSFGYGGVFSALRSMDGSIAERYELIGEMQDMKIGDAHLLENVNDAREQTENKENGGTRDRGDGEGADNERVKKSVALMIAQSSKKRGEIKSETLSVCFSKLSYFIVSSGKPMSVHMPRIGYGMPDVSWYAIERLAKKYFTDKGIPTYIYYISRRQRREYQMDAQRHTPAPAPRDDREDRRRTRPGTTRTPKAKRAKTENLEGFVVDDSEEDSEESEESTDSEGDASDNWEPEENGKEESSEDEPMEDDGSEEEEEGEEKEEDERVKEVERGERRQRRETVVKKEREEEKEEDMIEPADEQEQHDDGDFSEFVVSLIGLEEEKKDMVDKLSDMIVDNEGYIVPSLKDPIFDSITHVIVPKHIEEGDEESFESFRSQFDTDVFYLSEEWMKECCEKGKKVPIDKYVLH